MEMDIINELKNRFLHHPPATQETADAHAVARGLVSDLAISLHRLVPMSREAAVMVTKLEEALFWANAAIARNQLAAPTNEAPAAVNESAPAPAVLPPGEGIAAASDTAPVIQPQGGTDAQAQ